MAALLTATPGLAAAKCYEIKPSMPECVSNEARDYDLTHPSPDRSLESVAIAALVVVVADVVHADDHWLHAWHANTARFFLPWLASLSEKPAVCIPDEVSVGQYIAVINKYLRDHPEERHRDFNDILGMVALALPDKPSIAVLPFQNMSGDPEQDYFADGMVEAQGIERA